MIRLLLVFLLKSGFLVFYFKNMVGLISQSFDFESEIWENEPVDL